MVTVFPENPRDFSERIIFEETVPEKEKNKLIYV